MGESVEEGESGGASRARANRSWAPGDPSGAELSVAIERSVAQALRDRPGLVEKLVDVIEAGLGATKSHFDLVQKCFVPEVDFKERREMAKLALAYLDGLPVQTVVGVGPGAAGSGPRLAEALERSPGARRALEGFLARSGVVLDLPRVAPAGDQDSPSGSGASAPS